MALCACRRLYPAERSLPLVVVGSHLLPSPVLCGLGARGHLLSGPQPVVHHVVTARALAPPLAGSFVGGLRPRDLPDGRHPSYAASTFCRFRTFTLRIHGYLQASHNISELNLRREVVGRRNWLFVGSEDGANANTTFVSLIASCRMLGLEPYAYLRDLLCLLPSWPKHRLLELAPAYWNKTLEQSDAQKRLDANIFRRVALGLPVS